VFIELTDMDIGCCIPLKVAQDLASGQSSRREGDSRQSAAAGWHCGVDQRGSRVGNRKEVRRYDPNALLPWGREGKNRGPAVPSSSTRIAAISTWTNSGSRWRLSYASSERNAQDGTRAS